MSMVSEQIEELRLMSEMFVNGEPYGNLLRRAANTIEMLSEKARADRPQGWTPCSERLPDEDGEYLVTQKNGSIGIYVFNYDGNSEEYFKRCATAWMPLPEPWKGVNDDRV